MTYCLLLCHVSNSPLVLHSQHGYLAELVFLVLFEDLLLPLRRESDHHLLLKSLVLPSLDLHGVVVLLLDLKLFGLFTKQCKKTVFTKCRCAIESYGSLDYMRQVPHHDVQVFKAPSFHEFTVEPLYNSHQWGMNFWPL